MHLEVNILKISTKRLKIFKSKIENEDFLNNFSQELKEYLQQWFSRKELWLARVAGFVSFILIFVFLILFGKIINQV